MPGGCKAAQSVVAARGIEDGLHGSIMTIVPCLRKTIAAGSAGPPGFYGKR
jgi:hypothetical protein